MSQDITEALQPEDYTPEASEHWKVASIRSADWAVRKLALIREARAERQAYVAEVQAWAKAEDERVAMSEAFFEAALAAWHMEQLEINPKAKTISLPSGKLVARKNPDSYKADPAAFVAWAKEHRPEWVRTKVIEDPAVTEIRKIVKDTPHDPETGERIPGLEIEPGAVVFKVEVDQ